MRRRRLGNRIPFNGFWCLIEPSLQGFKTTLERFDATVLTEDLSVLFSIVSPEFSQLRCKLVGEGSVSRHHEMFR